MKNFTAASLLALSLVLVGCTRTPSNVHVISTTNCGATWEKLNVGSAVPKHSTNPCGYTTALPNWPMAGEAVFKTQFAKGVISTVRFSYSYTIVDPLAFVDEARYLGKMGGSLEIGADDVGARYEMAENIIIDKLLRDVTVGITNPMEVVDANPAKIEDDIYNKTKDALVKKGVLIADMALVIENDQQTRLAIDSVTAMRVYDAAGMRSVGEQIIAARAGATQINVHTGLEKQ